MARQTRKPAGGGKVGQSARIEPKKQVQPESVKIPEIKQEVSLRKMIGYFGGWLIIPGIIFWLISQIWK